MDTPAIRYKVGDRCEGMDKRGKWHKAIVESFTSDMEGVFYQLSWVPGVDDDGLLKTERMIKAENVRDRQAALLSLCHFVCLVFVFLILGWLCLHRECALARVVSACTHGCAP